VLLTDTLLRCTTPVHYCVSLLLPMHCSGALLCITIYYQCTIPVHYYSYEITVALESKYVVGFLLKNCAIRFSTNWGNWHTLNFELDLRITITQWYSLDLRITITQRNSLNSISYYWDFLLHNSDSPWDMILYDFVIVLVTLQLILFNLYYFQLSNIESLQYSLANMLSWYLGKTLGILILDIKCNN